MIARLISNPVQPSNFTTFMKSIGKSLGHAGSQLAQGFSSDQAKQNAASDADIIAELVARQRASNAIITDLVSINGILVRTNCDLLRFMREKDDWLDERYKELQQKSKKLDEKDEQLELLREQLSALEQSSKGSEKDE